MSMISKATLRLLLLNDSRQEAERWVSMLQNAGRQVRAQHVESEEALVKLLQEQTWDILIGLDTTKSVTPAAAIRHIRRLHRDLPVILLTDDEGTKPLVEGLKMGAQDVVRLDEDQHLLLVLAREQHNRENRNLQRLAERRAKEMERRNQQLLDSSRNAIALLQDGMVLYCNDSFASALGYADRDEVECMPLIDMVVEEDQARVKDFLKTFLVRAGDAEMAPLSFRVDSEDKGETQLEVEVRKARHEDEICLQFLIPHTALAPAAPSAEAAKPARPANEDPVTGLPNKNQLLEWIERSIDAAMREQSQAALMCIAMEDFLETVQAKVGLAALDQTLISIAQRAQALLAQGEVLCRFADDSFMLLTPGLDADTALARAQQLAETLNSHIVDIRGTTLQLQFRVGVALVNDVTNHSDTAISHAIKALDLARAAHAKDKATHSAIYEDVSEQSNDARSNREITQLVQKALDQKRFRLLFQPILSLRGSDREHYEVLLRILDQHDNGISPNEFMAVAQRMGAAGKIDRWVLEESIKTLAEHRKKGNNTRLFINLSRDSLKDANLVPWLRAKFKEADLSPDGMVFQLQEGDVADHLNLAKTFTEQIAQVGSECAITRFGCALNPFSNLQHINVQYVKVDGSFTQELQRGNGEPEALGDLLAQIHEHEKITIVPFVENASVLSKLWQSGVHYIQGYYLQGPADSMNYDFDTES